MCTNNKKHVYVCIYICIYKGNLLYKIIIINLIKKKPQQYIFGNRTKCKKKNTHNR